MQNILKFIKSQPVLIISFVAAAVTLFVIPPDAGYADYISYGVLAELFALMIASSGLRGAGVFDHLTHFVLKKSGSVRGLAAIFVSVCFYTSMFVTNDVALITFVPITLLAFAGIDDEKSKIFTVVLETAAANLGSMLTPIGNPQNLFIYDEYSLTPMQFVSAMLPAGIISYVSLMLMTLFIPKKACSPEEQKPAPISKLHTAVFGILFAVCITAVFRLIPFWICAVAGFAAAVVFDRKLLLKADYALLATFVCFFVFVGNISRIEAVHTFFSGIMQGNEVVISALLSQVISNVPAAVMLSGFTTNGIRLMIGVNIGGLGTPIASMASLISLQFYRREKNAQTGRYLIVFSVVNFVMLVLLLVFHLFILKV